MSIEKMEFVSISGSADDLDEVLMECCRSGCFQIESASQMSDSGRSAEPLSSVNPYTQPLKDTISLASGLQMKLQGVDFSGLELNTAEQLSNAAKEIDDASSDVEKRLKELADDIDRCTQAKKQIEHLKGLDIDFERLFACEHVKIRFGRMPCDSLEKLGYYDDKPMFFFPFDNDDEYCWGFYMTPFSEVVSVDDIFGSLYFERMRIPDFVKGNANDALSSLEAQLSADSKELEELKGKVKEIAVSHGEKLNMIFSKLKYLHDNYDLRRYVAIFDGSFHIVGFVPKDSGEEFEKRFERFNSVSVVRKPPEIAPRIKPPTKLKNGWFSRPFTLFVEMYGLPEYGAFNPTAFLAVTYTILFGIMFGDVGQGIVLAILGAVIAKKTSNKLAQIAVRLGASSTLFGLVYGSVFGNEELLNPMYKALGFASKPFEVMEKIQVILVAAIAIGVVIIITVMGINIVCGLKKRDYESAVFGSSGVCGLVFFVSLILGAVLTLIGIKVFSVPYILILIVLPLILIFLRQPLACMMKKKKYKSEGAGQFIATNFFELFEFLLSYATNTLSFIRIGGFVLSHAAMMAVVVSIAEMSSGVVPPIVMILGNIFVMAIEGLLVGIQVLRLQYYEMFSRYYSGGGRPYKPVTVSFAAEAE